MPHRAAPATTANGWDAVEMDLSDLDAAAAERRAERAPAGSTVGGSRRRHRRSHGSSRSGSRIGRSEFNRRVQLVLFVALLLLGVAVVFRACSSDSRRTEPELLGQPGQARVGIPFDLRT